MHEYEMIMQKYISGEDDNTQIFELLTPIARKQYRKDEQLAAFQEQFYQQFMSLDKKNINGKNRCYHETITKRLRIKRKNKLAKMGM